MLDNVAWATPIKYRSLAGYYLSRIARIRGAVNAALIKITDNVNPEILRKFGEYSISRNCHSQNAIVFLLVLTCIEYVRLFMYTFSDL